MKKNVLLSFYLVSLAILLLDMHIAYAGSTEQPRDAVRRDWAEAYEELQKIIDQDGFLYCPDARDKVKQIDPLLAERGIGNDHIESAYDRQAFFLPSDRDPLDVVLRRTRALLDFSDQDASWKVPDATVRRLPELAQQAEAATEQERAELYTQVCELRRRIAFSNPRLDFDRLLLGTRKDVRNCVSISLADGQGYWEVQDPFGPRSTVRDIFENRSVTTGPHAGTSLSDGVCGSLELSFDASRILFSWKPEPMKGKDLRPRSGRSREDFCHIFEADLDTDACRQLSRGSGPDFDPCYLPSGRIAFTSYRRSPVGMGMHIRCISFYPSV